MIVILHIRITYDTFIIHLALLMYLNFVFYLPEDDHMVGRNMQYFTVNMD
jgi:hypothetical protein